MLEKNPEKRISAEQALNHRFLTTDRPIFKFKKSNKFDQ
jgi:serine/threonine protein kinase